MSAPFIRLADSFFENFLWTEERAFSRAEAWLDLVRTVTRRPWKRLVNGELVDVPRGGLVASERYLSDRWMWSRTKVRAYLDTLESEQMIERKKTTHNTIVSLCKYAQYNPEKNQPETSEEPAGNQQETKEVDVVDKKKSSSKAAPATSDEEWMINLCASPAYEGIDVRREYEKAKVWYSTRNKRVTRRAFVGWLNKADAPLFKSPPAQSKASADPLWLKFLATLSQQPRRPEYDFAPDFLKTDFAAWKRNQ